MIFYTTYGPATVPNQGTFCSCCERFHRPQAFGAYALTRIRRILYLRQHQGTVPVNIISQIPQPDFGFSSDNTYRTHQQQSGPLCLHPEDMFNTVAYLKLRLIVG